MVHVRSNVPENAIEEVEQRWGNLSKIFSTGRQMDVPVPPKYHPKLDDIPLLSEDETQLYQSYIGIIRWAVEIGRIDLCMATGVMARFSVLPREGHMYTVLRILAYAKKYIESKLVFDPLAKDFDDTEWTSRDWSSFYTDVEELLPGNIPEPRGKPVQINMFCDASHASCLASRRPTTGIVIFLNGAPVTWYSKRQNTVESSAFGSEFVVLKIATEMNEGLRYKLRMMGVPIEGPTNCFYDNQSVVGNVSLPESTLQKKHNSIAYHKVREAVAQNTQRVTHEKVINNLSDALTKFLGPKKFRNNIQCILWR